MFTRERLTSAYNNVDKENLGSLTFEKIVRVCQSMGMNTTGQKVINYFENQELQTAGEVNLEEFIQWFRTTNPNLYSE